MLRGESANEATALVALALALTALLMTATTAEADERVCRGTIGAKTVDNLKVPQGASCNLNSTKVKGTIEVQNRARLVANKVRVNGNIQSEGYKSILVRRGSIVGGSVQLKNGLKGGSGRVLNTRVTGDLQYEENFGKMVARNNKLLANLQAVQNKGGLVISKNRVSENLQCKENKPAPIGGGNTAGDKEGQCARL